ncbi:hypothetical protein NOM01_10945 [Sporolactobacillus sp. STSJ-5]|uniref:hypothetical protein n=1 Tax=Sporolactobacillus sp. STSJ-5 TaxID=2965076 RepID=UPI0021055A8F|nr:hypothetical protein [Sporolactobacillus sp. STSJ-5]MCQ2010532.1 hypothetical protein [Sporolactobacillus sp. STSJ-5]
MGVKATLDHEIDLIQNNVNFSLELTWTILGVVVAIIGVALYFLSKLWVEKRVDKTLESLTNSVKGLEKSSDDFNQRLNKMIVGNGASGWGYTHLEDGTHICYLKAKAPDHSCSVKYSFPCAFNKKEDVIPTISMLNSQYVSACIESFDAGGITVVFDIPDKVKTINEDETMVSIIAIGKF